MSKTRGVVIPTAVSGGLEISFNVGRVFHDKICHRFVETNLHTRMLASFIEVVRPKSDHLQLELSGHTLFTAQSQFFLILLSIIVSASATLGVVTKKFFKSN